MNQIVDVWGNPITSKKPNTNQITEGGLIYNDINNYPSVRMTPQKLAAILRDADNGYVNAQAELFSEMEEKDGKLGSVLQTRRLAVTGLDWEVLPATTNSATDIKVAEFITEVFNYVDSFNEGLNDLLDAIGKGFSLVENIWEISEGQVWLKDLEHVDGKNLNFTDVSGKLSKMPRILTEESPAHGIELEPYKFIFHRHKARSGFVTKGGIIRSCAYLYLFKNYDFKNWAQFIELFGIPLRLGKFKAGSTREEIDVLKRAVFNLASDAAAVISENTEIEFIRSEAGKDNAGVFKELAEYIDKIYSQIVLGHAGSSESTAGKLGGEDNAENVRQDLLKADCLLLMSTIKTQLITPLVYYNFGANVGVPKFKLKFEPPEDLKSEADMLVSLTKTGFRNIPLSYIHRRFAIPEPKKSEATLASSTPSSDLNAGGDLSPMRAVTAAAVALTADAAHDETVQQYQRRADHVGADQMIDTLKDFISSCETLEEARDRLPEVFPGMDEKALASALAEALMASSLAGRYEGRK